MGLNKWTLRKLLSLAPLTLPIKVHTKPSILKYYKRIPNTRNILKCFIKGLTNQNNIYCKYNMLKKKQYNPAQNTIENVMDLTVIMGIVLVLMETIMVSTGMWWILLVGC